MSGPADGEVRGGVRHRRDTGEGGAVDGERGEARGDHGGTVEDEHDLRARRCDGGGDPLARGRSVQQQHGVSRIPGAQHGLRQVGTALGEHGDQGTGGSTLPDPRRRTPYQPLEFTERDAVGAGPDRRTVRIRGGMPEDLPYEVRARPQLGGGLDPGRGGAGRGGRRKKSQCLEFGDALPQELPGNALFPAIGRVDQLDPVVARRVQVQVQA